MSPSIFDPDEDEWGAQRRDLHRLDEILRSRMPEGSDSLGDAVPHLGPAELEEVRAILIRLNLGEDPERLAARQTVLLHYAFAEAAAIGLLIDPGPLVDDNGIVYGPDGNPVLNEKVRSDAREILALIEHDRAVVMGEAEDDEDEED